MAFRRRFKRSFRNRRFRRSFRRTSIRRRIIGRALRRRPLRPEIKFIDKANVNDPKGETVSAGFVSNWQITPTSIPNGTTLSDRIGQQVMFRKCMLNIHIENFYRVVADTYITRVRVLIVCPRVDAANFLTYLTTFNTLSAYIDPNLATVYMDKEYNLSNIVAASASVNNYAGTGDRASLNIRKVIPFPRKVEFRRGSDQIQDSKDQLYLIVMNNNTLTSGANIGCQWRTRTTYVDA